ncbi:MAG: TetR/AcrR family transcriptional regulator [Polyangiaceae bacterium]
MEATEPRAYHHGNLRRELIDAALRLFAERGDLEFTFRELARAVGVTHNAPYRHFATRDELLAAVREEGFARLAREEKRALRRAGTDPKARVRALGEAYVRFAVEEPVLFRLVLSEGEHSKKPQKGAPTESFALLESTLEEGRVGGALRKDLSSRELALVAWALVHGLASLVSGGRLPAGKSQLHRYSDLAAAVFFEGAAASAAAQPRAAGDKPRASRARVAARS